MTVLKKDMLYLPALKVSTFLKSETCSVNVSEKMRQTVD